MKIMKYTEPGEPSTYVTSIGPEIMLSFVDKKAIPASEENIRRANEYIKNNNLSGIIKFVNKATA